MLWQFKGHYGVTGVKVKVEVFDASEHLGEVAELFAYPEIIRI